MQWIGIKSQEFSSRNQAPRWAVAFLASASAAACGCGMPSRFGVEAPDADYWRGYLTDTGAVLSAPARWDAKGWRGFAAFAGGAAVIHAFDADLRDAALDARTDRTYEVAAFAEHFGDGLYVLPGLALAYGIGAATDDRRLREASLLGAEGFVVAGTVNGLLKFAFGRRRPADDVGPGEFTGFSLEDHSMPSGHTAVAFAVATAFHLEYRNPWVSTLAYALATLTALSRVHDDAHWASDVAVGAGVGIFSVRVIFDGRAKRKK